MLIHFDMGAVMKALIDKIKDRCVIDEWSGCWIWNGANSPGRGGYGIRANIYSVDFTTDPSGKTKSVQTGNRASWHANTGKPIPAGKIVFKTRVCEHSLCVNPDHMTIGTRNEFWESLRQSGVWKSQQKRIAANRATGAKRSVVTPELLLEIQQSQESVHKIAKRLNVSKTTISKARRGEIVSIQRVNNPFAGLMK